jgi:putative flippase GtrA
MAHNSKKAQMKEKLRQLSRFATVGFINTAIGLAVIYIAMFIFNLGPLLSNALGYGLGLIISFILNRNWTFSDGRAIGKTLPIFLIVVAISYFLNIVIIFICISHLKLNPYLAQPLGIGLYTFLVYFGSRKFVFRKADHQIDLITASRITDNPHNGRCG